MSYRQLFFLGTAFLGETPRHAVRVHEGYLEPSSLVWLCRSCGEVYQRAPVVKADGSTTPWQPLRGLCPRCPSRWLSDWPGTFYLPLETEYNAALPPEVLLHDFHAHHSHFKRFFP